jgi:hypothetical protein
MGRFTSLGTLETGSRQFECILSTSELFRPILFSVLQEDLQVDIASIYSNKTKKESVREYRCKD